MDARDVHTFSRVKELWRQTNEPPSDAATWARENAQIQMWSKQIEICRSVQENKFTAVKSCHGIGKSFTASALACWWVATHPVNDVMVVTTAPSKDQVSGILWQNIMKIHRKANLQGEVLGNDEWKIGGLQVGIGRKPHDYNKDTFQGYHRRYLLVILDEAAGIPEWIWDGADNIATGPDCRILAIGNPTDPTSRFKRVCDPGSGWNVVTVSFFDSPAWTGERVSDQLKAELVDIPWMEKKRANFGENSPEWDARVLANFPTSNEASVIPYPWIEQAQQRYKEWVSEGMPVQKGRKIIACDVARFGRDQTVIAKRQGPVFWGIETFVKQDTEETADKVMNRTDRYTDMTIIDANGIGAGVVDKLVRRKYPCTPFNAQARTNAVDATGEWGFTNLRSAAIWNLRELLDPSRGYNLMLQDDEDLAADLIAPTWKEVVGAKIQIESKDEIRARTGRSPDRGDTCVMAFWIASGYYDDVENDGAVPWTDSESEDGAEHWEVHADPHFELLSDEMEAVSW